MKNSVPGSPTTSPKQSTTPKSNKSSKFSTRKNSGALKVNLEGFSNLNPDINIGGFSELSN